MPRRSAPSANTPRGSNVAVTPVDAATGSNPVRLTFDTVTEPGDTVLVIGVVGPPPPPGVTGGRPPRFHDLSTTAAFTGNVEVCVSYAGTTFDSIPSLWHFENGGWVDITVRHDRAPTGGLWRHPLAVALCGVCADQPAAVARSAGGPNRRSDERHGSHRGLQRDGQRSRRGPAHTRVRACQRFPVCVGCDLGQCSVVDSAGAGAEGRFSVTVRDTTPPALTVPHHVSATPPAPPEQLSPTSTSAEDRVDGAVAPACATGFGRHLPHWQYHRPLHRHRCARQRRTAQLHGQRHRRHSVDHRQAERQRT